MTFGFEAGVGMFVALVLCSVILANIEVVLGGLFVAGVALWAFFAFAPAPTGDSLAFLVFGLPALAIIALGFALRIAPLVPWVGQRVLRAGTLAKN